MSLVNTVALNKQAIEIESKMPGINNLIILLKRLLKSHRS